MANFVKVNSLIYLRVVVHAKLCRSAVNHLAVDAARQLPEEGVKHHSVGQVDCLLEVLVLLKVHLLHVLVIGHKFLILVLQTWLLFRGLLLGLLLAVLVENGGDDGHKVRYRLVEGLKINQHPSDLYTRT